MIGPPPQLHSAAQLRTPSRLTVAGKRRAVAIVGSSNETALKWLIATLFLPEGLSFFIGDFRLSVARVLIIILTIRATAQYFRSCRTLCSYHQTCWPPPRVCGWSSLPPPCKARSMD